MRPLAGGCIAIALGLAAGQALAQDSCSNRGDLDLLYCDENKDLVADAPRDPKKFKNPSTLVFTRSDERSGAFIRGFFASTFPRGRRRLHAWQRRGLVAHRRRQGARVFGTANRTTLPFV